MDPPECISAPKVLNVLLAIVAAKAEAGTFVEIYPLLNKPNTQLLPNVYKYHIRGLVLYKLGGLLKTQHGAIQFVSDTTSWNNLLEDELSYSFTLKLIKTKKGRRRSMCLDVTQLVDVETADLNMDEMGFLELCRSSFKEIEEKLATNKKKTANTDTTTNTDTEKSKRKITNTIKVTPGPRQSKHTKLLQYGTHKGDVVQVPKNATIQSVYKVKKASKEICSLKAKIQELQKRLAISQSTLLQKENECILLKEHVQEKVNETRNLPVLRHTTKHQINQKHHD